MTDVQKQKVVDWIQQGLKLSEIQTRLDSELGVRLTYMEVKMLLAELELKPKDQEPAKAATTLGAPAAAPSPAELPDPSSGMPQGFADESQMPPDGSLPDLGGNVSVTVDTLTRPGTMVSGKVTFSDKKTAEWYLDQTGRLGMAPSEKGYRPSQMDVIAFQTELQNQLAKMGM
jgi:hypothetical protein